MLSIDGSTGLGGGQVLRTSLSLAALLQKPFRMHAIRAGRSKPGLQLQHLTAVKAAAEVCGAKLEGAVLGSQEIAFKPGEAKAGNYSFDIGSAGSTTLVLETLLPALIFANEESKVRIIGGTSNPLAPSSLFVEKAFLPTLRKLGVECAFTTPQHGYFPKGGGVIEARVQPVEGRLKQINLLDRSSLNKLQGFSIVSNLPLAIAERMKIRALKNLSEAGFNEGVKIELVNAPSVGQGAEFFLLAEYADCANGFSALGEPGKPAEKVAGEAVHAFKEFHASGACFEQHLADQLLLYACLADGESTYSVSKVTKHLLTNAWVIKQFLPECKIEVHGGEGEKGKVVVSGIAFSRKN